MFNVLFLLKRKEASLFSSVIHALVGCFPQGGGYEFCLFLLHVGIGANVGFITDCNLDGDYCFMGRMLNAFFFTQWGIALCYAILGGVMFFNPAIFRKSLTIVIWIFHPILALLSAGMLVFMLLEWDSIMSHEYFNPEDNPLEVTGEDRIRTFIFSVTDFVLNALIVVLICPCFANAKNPCFAKEKEDALLKDEVTSYQAITDEEPSIQAGSSGETYQTSANDDNSAGPYTVV